VMSDLMERDLLQRIKDSAFVTLQEAKESDSRQATIAFIQTGLFIVSASVFLYWFYLAYRNLLAFGIGWLRYSPRWTWLGFVIPIFNLFRPYQIAAEIWTISNPNTLNRSDAVDPIVKWWWGIFLVVNELGRILLRTSLRSDTIDQALNGNLLTIFLDGSYILAAGITILFVRSLTQRQEQKYAALTATLRAEAA
jgi:Domain of unknown function (DUF4328)